MLTFAIKKRPETSPPINYFCPAKAGQQLYFEDFVFQLNNKSPDLWGSIDSEVVDRKHSEYNNKYGTIVCLKVVSERKLDSNNAKWAEQKQKETFNNIRANSFTRVYAKSTAGQNSSGKPGSAHFALYGRLVFVDADGKKYFCHGVTIAQGYKDFHGNDWWVYSNYPFINTANMHDLLCEDDTIPNRAVNVEVKPGGDNWHMSFTVKAN
jgi:hypothetical protein